VCQNSVAELNVVSKGVSTDDRRMARPTRTQKNREPEQIAFGEEVRRRRLALDYSQEDFAHHFGIDRTYFGRVERGEYNVTLVTALKIIKALEVTPAEFFKGLQDRLQGEPPKKRSRSAPPG
jgi:DNA-binding XRE family transcriptional regulator